MFDFTWLACKPSWIIQWLSLKHLHLRNNFFPPSAVIYEPKWVLRVRPNLINHLYCLESVWIYYRRGITWIEGFNVPFDSNVWCNSGFIIQHVCYPHLKTGDYRANMWELQLMFTVLCRQGTHCLWEVWLLQYLNEKTTGKKSSDLFFFFCLSYVYGTGC